MNHKTQQKDDIQAILHLGVTRCAFIFCCLVSVLAMIRVGETLYDVHTRRQESHHDGEMNEPQKLPHPSVSQCTPLHFQTCNGKLMHARFLGPGRQPEVSYFPIKLVFSLLREVLF